MITQCKLNLMVLIHLLLLLYPQMVKSVHVHHNEPVCFHHDFGVSFEIPDERCPVCDFEFVSFIENSPIRFQVNLPEIKLIDLPVCEAIYTNHLFYFSLRAPPIS